MIDAFPPVRQMETHKTTPPSQQIPAVIEDTVDNACHDECYNDAIHKSSSIEAQILPKACLTGEDSVGNELVPPVANSSHVESVFRSFPTLTKDQTVQRLALLYSKKSVSLSALSVKSPNFLVIWDMMIPTNKVGQKYFHHFSLREVTIRKLKTGIINPLSRVIVLQINIEGIPIFKQSVEM
jgi:hypothetical protein